MDYLAFLNSSGAILSPYPYEGNGSYAAHIPIAPNLEPVVLPVVSVDSSALYGEHPENLATLTYSSGAALTFYCDSEAGGTNTSGAGTFDDPWRSLHTASRYLSCNECVLAAAAPYVQLKVKGTVDYVSESWQPWRLNYRRLILTGWDEMCDLGSWPYLAGYMFGVQGRGVLGGGCVYSGCILSRYYDGQSAVDCKITAPYDVAARYGSLSVAVNCSGGGVLNAEVIAGGSFTASTIAHYISGATINTSNGSAALRLSSAAADVTVVNSGSAIQVGIEAESNTFLRDCNVSVFATDSRTTPGQYGYYTALVWATCVSGMYSGTVISGGTLYAYASAYASRYEESYSYAAARAEATAICAHYVKAVNGVTWTATASASAFITVISGYGHALATEATGNNFSGGYANLCSRYTSTTVTNNTSSSWTGSGGACS